MIFRQRQGARPIPRGSIVVKVLLRSDLHHLPLSYIEPSEYTKRFRGYYNEIDPYAAQWLRNLIAAGHIAPGDVDERSIVDVRADDLRGYRQCHFFAGVGVWSYALRLAGWPDELEVWTGSCPCQPFSAAGRSGGFDDGRHLWPHWSGLIGERRPGVVFGEQVASADGLAWLDFVCADLEGAGYAVGANRSVRCGLRGAPHPTTAVLRGRRRRRFESEGSPTSGFWRDCEWVYHRDAKWRPTEPGTFPLAHGATERVGRLRAYGNAIVAPVAAEFIRAYRECVS
jgi:DNA (cytosine-5)-methyltransferase 1